MQGIVIRAPREVAAIVAACGALPFEGRRESLFRPSGEGLGVGEGDVDDGQAGLSGGEVFRQRTPDGFAELLELFVGDLGEIEVKRRYGNPFVVSAEDSFTGRDEDHVACGVLGSLMMMLFEAGNRLTAINQEIPETESKDRGERGGATEHATVDLDAALSRKGVYLRGVLVEPVFEVGGDFAHALRSFRGIALHARADDLDKTVRDGSGGEGFERNGLVEDEIEDPLDAVGLNGFAAGEDLVEEHAVGVDVDQRGDRLAHDEFRGDVVGRSESEAGLREVGVFRLDNAEIHQLDAAMGVDVDVVRLHIAVDIFARVDVL